MSGGSSVKSAGKRWRMRTGMQRNVKRPVSPATHGSAGPLPRKTRHAVTQRASASLCTKCTRFDIIAVLYTCTTVASRVATSACATHLRFLTKPGTSPCLASSSPWASGDSTQEEFLSRNYLFNGWLPVLLIIPFEFEGALVLKPTVPSPPRLLKHR